MGVFGVFGGFGRGDFGIWVFAGQKCARELSGGKGLREAGKWLRQKAVFARLKIA